MIVLRADLVKNGWNLYPFLVKMSSVCATPCRLESELCLLAGHVALSCRQLMLRHMIGRIWLM